MVQDLKKYPVGAESLAFHSITRAMERYEFSVSEITGIHAMCCNLERTALYLNAPAVREFVGAFDLDVYGHTDALDAITLSHPRVRLHHSPQPLMTHYTLIELHRKPRLLWFEPSHQLMPVADAMKRRGFTANASEIELGAHLLPLTNDPLRIRELYSHFTSL